MAKDKEKHINKAQNFLRRGQADKAIKEFLKALEVDKKDVRLYMQLGNVFSKKKDNEKAVEYYSQAAKYLTKDGFYSRAAAVYRQIIQIDDSNIEILESLADLYTKLGLNNEAMAQYQTISAMYEREGKMKEAVEVIQRMLDLDPANVVIATKLAELYYKSGMKKQGYEAFRRALDQLQEEGRYEQYLKLLEKLAKAEPDNNENLKELGDIYVEHERWDRAYAVFARIHSNNPEDTEILDPLSNAALKAGQPDEAVKYLKKLANTYQSKGLKQRAKETLRKVLQIRPDDPDALAVVGKSDPLLDEEPLEEIEDVIEAPEDIEIIEEPLEILEEAEPEEEVLIEVDDAVEETEAPSSITPEQIVEHLTEAGVYLKYGLRDKALDHIRIILKADPKNLKAHLKLKDVYIESGETDKAVKELAWVAKNAVEAGDHEIGSEAVKEWLRIEPDSAEALQFMREVEAVPEAREAVEPEVLDEAVEIEELEVIDEAVEVEDDEVMLEEPEPEVLVLEEEEEVAIEAEEKDDAVEIEAMEEEVAEEDDALEVEAMEEEVAEEDDDEVAIEAVEDEIVAEEVKEDKQAPAAPEPVAADFSEELEEADFYIQQGLHGEAKKILLSILKQNPSHEISLNKLKELDREEPEEVVISDGEPAVSFSEEEPEEPAAPEPEPELEITAPPAIEPEPPPVEEEPVEEEPAAPPVQEAPVEEPPPLEPEVPAAPPVQEAPVVEEAAPEPEPVPEAPDEEPPPLEPEVPAAPPVQEAPVVEEAAPEPEPVPEAPVEEPPPLEPEVPAASPVQEAPVAEEAAPEPPPVEEARDPLPPPAAAPEAREEGFDLLAEVQEGEPQDKEFFVEPAPPPASDLFETSSEEESLFDLAAELEKDDELSGGGSELGLGSMAEEFSFEETLQAFKKGVSETISENDSATHYDLGIAYKEMGLVDEAVETFLKASLDPARYGECMLMTAMTLREGGQTDKSIETCKTAIISKNINDNETGAIYFELGQDLVDKDEKPNAKWALEKARVLISDLPGIDAMISDLSGVEADPLVIEDETDTEEQAPPEQAAPAPQPAPESKPPVETGPPPSREQTSWEKAALENPETDAKKEEEEKKKKKKRKKISYV